MINVCRKKMVIASEFDYYLFCHIMFIKICNNPIGNFEIIIFSLNKKMQWKKNKTNTKSRVPRKVFKPMRTNQFGAYNSVYLIV